MDDGCCVFSSESVYFFRMRESDVARCVSIASESAKKEVLSQLDPVLRMMLWTDDSHLFVAALPTGQVVGWFCAAPQEYFLGKDVPNISIYITESYRGAGIGTRALAFLLSLPGLTRDNSKGFVIFTHQQNVAMCKLAERTGFVEVLSFPDGSEIGDYCLYFLKGKGSHMENVTRTLTAIDSYDSGYADCRRRESGADIVVKRCARDPDNGPEYLSIRVKSCGTLERRELVSFLSECVTECLSPKLCDVFTAFVDSSSNSVIRDALQACGGVEVRSIQLSLKDPTRCSVFRI